MLFLLLALLVQVATPTHLHAQTAPTCSIHVSPSTITVGGTVVVSWSSQNAVSGSITHIGSVGLSGSSNLLPSSASQTVFTGTFTGPGGTATCSGTVSVTTSSGGGSTGSTGGTGTTGMTGDSTGGTYTTGTSYNTSKTYSVTPSSATQPANSSFNGSQTTVNTGSTGGTASGSLVPCGAGTTNLSGQAYTDAATSCNLCYLGQLGQNIINFFFMLSIPLSAAAFAWAGILYFTSAGNENKVKKARAIFTSVFIGFVLVVASYLIVQTLLNALLNKSFSTNGWSWQSLQCSGDRGRHNTIGDIFQGLFNPSSGGNGLTSTNPSGGDTGLPSAGAAPLGETAARTALAAASNGQITVNSACADGQTGCVTQLGGVKADVLAGAEAIQAACASGNGGSCPLVITGGSESHGGGATDPHAAGNAVDIRTSSVVDAQMRSTLGLGSSNPTPSTSGSGYPAQINGQSFIVYFEGDHWHLQAKR